MENKGIQNTISLALFMLCLASNLFSQKDVRVSGFVKDKSSSEVLIGANIIESGSSNGSISDYNGYFSILIKSPGTVQVSFIGYKPALINVSLTSDTLLNVFLEAGSELNEVVVKAQRVPKFNVATLKSIELQQIPALGGKPDVLKAIQLLPGIQTQNEGSSLLLVRGGDPGQNLYLIDNIPLIYVNHLGGFTSVFNPDIINNIDVYKGGFPARYGGKLSSVVDITQKEGDRSGLKGSLSLGISDASFSLEGPLKMKNTGFILTGRKTMIDPLMLLASSLSREGGFRIMYGFHDINGKFTWKPDKANSLHINLYEGDDYLNYWSFPPKDGNENKNRFMNIWGNRMISADWKHVASPKLFSFSTISYTQYRLKEKQKASLANGNVKETYKSEYLNSVQDLSLRTGLKYNVSRNWTLDAGLQSSLLIHIPNYAFNSNLPVKTEKERLKAYELSGFVENRIHLPGGFELIPGIRFVNYFIKDYYKPSLEPRINLNLEISAQHFLNLSFMRISQYSHLIFTTGSIMNNEVWIPANKQIPLAQSEQITLGWNGGFRENMFTTELSIYYKTMSNLSTYKEGYTSLKGDANWLSKVETDGTGTAMGAEFLLRKNIGKWTGFAGYTISDASRQYPKINGGKEYLFDYNRRHAISMNASYKLNEKLTFSLTWIFQSGLPYTPPIGHQLVPSLEPNENGEYFYYDALIYGERNSSRMRDYHRLDLGLSYSTLNSKNRRVVWNFSVYNAYNRHNPYYYYFNTNNTGEIYIPEFGDDGIKPVSLYQMSLFPIIPSVSYKVFFDGNNKNIPRKTFKQKFSNWLYQKN
jgi:hypothetical protein